MKTVNGEWTECYTYEYNAANQLISRTNERLWTDNVTHYTYDADGNLISEQTGLFEKTYEYTAENRLAVVKAQGTVLMAALYDGDGNRLFTMDYTGENNDRWDIWIPECGGNADKVDDSAKDAMKELAGLVSWKDRKDYTITEYVNDVTRENEEVLAEINPRGKVTTAYTYGYNREFADVYGDTQYYLYDGQGNVSRISSEWGRVKETYAYDPYGNLTYGIPDTVNYYGYNGESSNLATGLQYLRARYYNPQNGNFITEDTYAGQISNPLTLNRYDYVSNNPLNYVDPSGHYSLEQFGKDVSNFFGGLYDAYQRGYDIQQKNQQYETQLITDFVFGGSDKLSKDTTKSSGKTDKISSDTAQKLTEDENEESNKKEDKNNPLLEKVNQIVSVHEKQQQAEMEIQKIYCEGLEEPNAETKVAIGVGVIVAAGVTTGISGGLTTPQLLGSIVGGLVGALVSYAFAEDDKEAAAADGFMWGTVTGVTLPTIGALVGMLGETITALSIPAIAGALEGFLETVMESFIAMIQGTTVSLAVFLSDWAWNSVTSGPNEPMKKVREWFKKNADEASAFVKKLLKGSTGSKIGYEYLDDQLGSLKDKVKINQYQSAESVNAWWEARGYKSPYKEKTVVQNITLTEDAKFVRVYDGVNSKLEGGWVMRAEDIKGLTPKEIQAKYALEYEPKFIGEVELKAGDTIRLGEVGPNFGFDGGGIQIDLQQQWIGNFTELGKIEDWR